MFGKVIVFGLFEMIQKKKKRGLRPRVQVRPPGQVEYGTAARAVTSVFSWHRLSSPLGR